MTEVVLKKRCEECSERLVLSAFRHELAQPATFAVRCPTCGARVRLASPVGRVQSVSAPGPDAS
jgi:hypothetical protein